MGRLRGGDVHRSEDGDGLPGPPQATFAGAETPPCWRISYFAQCRYRGGTIRVTVDHETAKVLATEIEFESGGASGPLDLPPFRLPAETSLRADPESLLEELRAIVEKDPDWVR